MFRGLKLSIDVIFKDFFSTRKLMIQPSNKSGKSGGSSRDWTSDGTIDRRWPRIISIFSLTTPESMSFKLVIPYGQVHQMTEDSSRRKKQVSCRISTQIRARQPSNRLPSSKSTFSALFSWDLKSSWRCKATWSMLIFTENKNDFK